MKTILLLLACLMLTGCTAMFTELFRDHTPPGPQHDPPETNQVTHGETTK